MYILCVKVSSDVACVLPTVLAQYGTPTWHVLYFVVKNDIFKQLQVRVDTENM